MILPRRHVAAPDPATNSVFKGDGQVGMVKHFAPLCERRHVCRDHLRG
jgi:hypothetical protein